MNAPCAPSSTFVENMNLLAPSTPGALTFGEMQGSCAASYAFTAPIAVAG